VVSDGISLLEITYVFHVLEAGTLTVEVIILTLVWPYLKIFKTIFFSVKIEEVNLIFVPTVNSLNTISAKAHSVPSDNSLKQFLPWKLVADSVTWL